jgi:hypothetical protein
MMQPKFYVKKPISIKAMELTEESYSNVRNWIGLENIQRINPQSKSIFIKTLEGVMEGQLGDFIICGVKGEFYPCKPDIFALSYTEVVS